MLFYMILLHILVNGDAGTTLFYNRCARTDCWNDEEIIKLRARQAFNDLIPHVDPEEVDVKYIKDALKYYRKSLNTVDNKADSRTRILLKEAMADTIGAHLRSEMLPVVRFAYYAGYIPYRYARQLHDLFEDIKVYLNTQGLGWVKPKRSQKWSNLTVAKIFIDAGTFFNPCSHLVTKRDANSCIHLPIPKHDDAGDPSVVALPFKSGGLFNLVAPNSDSILLKYYTTASKCILSSSPEKCRHTDFVSFNNDLWHWMKRDVAPHLMDEKLYAGYGGVLRIAAAVQNYGKGLSRRNLFEYHDAGLSGWHPWQSLSQSHIHIDADWTPALYIAIVILIAISIYLVQICYTYICGDGGCSCKGHSVSMFSNPLACANVETNVNTLSPQKLVYKNDQTRLTRHTVMNSASSRSRTQQVYDMNKNTEVMEIIMSDRSMGKAVISESQSSIENENVAGLKFSKRAKSPPKLQTSISQVTVSKKPRTNYRPPMYSTSSITRTATSHGKNASDSMWTGSETSGSSRSGSTTSSKSRRSRSSRDLAWAKRVISKHSSKSITKSTSRTEQEPTSNTSPTSLR